MEAFTTRYLAVHSPRFISPHRRRAQHPTPTCLILLLLHTLTRPSALPWLPNKAIPASGHKHYAPSARLAPPPTRDPVPSRRAQPYIYLSPRAHSTPPHQLLSHPHDPAPTVSTLQPTNQPTNNQPHTMPPLSSTLLPTLFATIFLALGTSYTLSPRATYPSLGLPAPSTPEDAALMDAVMRMFGAKDVFVGVALLVGTWVGSRRVAGAVSADTLEREEREGEKSEANGVADDGCGGGVCGGCEGVHGGRGVGALGVWGGYGCGRDGDGGVVRE